MEDKYSNIKYAHTDEEPKLQDRKVWRGMYKGISYEINSFPSVLQSHDMSWTYYLWIRLDQQFSKEVADKLWLNPELGLYGNDHDTRENISYDYFSEPLGEVVVRYILCVS